jgi:hypothetical protein
MAIVNTSICSKNIDKKPPVCYSGGMKTGLCSVCGITESKAFRYTKDRSPLAEGPGVLCNSCYRRKERLNNPEKIAAAKAKNYQENKEYYSQKNKLWKEENEEKNKKYHENYRTTNAVKVKEVKDKWYDEHREHILDRAHENYEKNKEKIIERVKQYKILNPGVATASNAKRRAQELQATPKWLTTEQLSEISIFYQKTPEGFQVDHIIPLQGKTCCGLHVPWNLQHIPKKMNQQKHNSIWEDGYTKKTLDAIVAPNGVKSKLVNTMSYKSKFLYSDKKDLTIILQHDNTEDLFTVATSGSKILVIRQHELDGMTDLINSMVDIRFDNGTKIQARKLNIKEANSHKLSIFFKENHMMGKYPASGFVLEDEIGTIYSAISYKIFKDGSVEIARFSSKKGLVVVGGLSKLLNAVVKKTKTNKIVSFVDLRYGDGHSLEKIGFKKIGVTRGWQWTDGFKCYNRLQCKANMDSRKLSEKEYAAELGWWKIEDAGQAKYVKEIK